MEDEWRMNGDMMDKKWINLNRASISFYQNELFGKRKIFKSEGEGNADFL
jgi:hypothetical protein